jgi:pSer/pThr/pTyr-binding forkhead associated (FHA) protein
VHVARKLVAAFEGGSSTGRAGRRFVVGMNPADYGRFESEHHYLERQWSIMLGRLAERSRLPQRPPEVLVVERPEVARGTVQIAVEPLTAPLNLRLRVRRGLPVDARFALNGTLVIGRDPSCDVVLPDPRVSRRHVEIDASGDAVQFTDLGSANGVVLNREERRGGSLDCGDVLRVGDTELVVEADE